MGYRSKNREVLTIILLCATWYIVSSSNNVIGKMLLNDFPFPMTVTMVQLTSITLYSGPLFHLWGVRNYTSLSWNYYFRLIVPLAFGKFLASVSSHISIWKVPVSYAHTGLLQTFQFCYYHILCITTISIIISVTFLYNRIVTDIFNGFNYSVRLESNHCLFISAHTLLLLIRKTMYYYLTNIE